MNADEAAQTLAACGLELRPTPWRGWSSARRAGPSGIYLAGLSLTRK